MLTKRYNGVIERLKARPWGDWTPERVWALILCLAATVRAHEQLQSAARNADDSMRSPSRIVAQRATPPHPAHPPQVYNDPLWILSVYLPTERTVLSMRRFLVVTTNASVGVFLAFALFALDKSYRPPPRPELPLRWGEGHGTMSEKVGGLFVVRHGKRSENKVSDPPAVFNVKTLPRIVKLALD